MGQITTVNFRNDTLFAVKRDDGIYVAIKPICDRLGLVWRKQQERISRDPILSKGITMVVMPSPGGPQETTCLRLNLVNGWLFTIDEDRVKDEETRQLVLLYKEECYAVLHDHFFGNRQPVLVEDPPEETQENDGLKLRKVDSARHVFGNQAAAQLWFKLGLERVPAMLLDPRQTELFTYTAIKAAPESKDEEAA